MVIHLSVAQSLNRFSSWFHRLFLINVIYLAVMSVFRMISLLAYGQSSSWTTDLFKVFWMGIRFDSVVLGYLLTIPALYLIAALHLRNEKVFEFFPVWARRYYLVFLCLILTLLALDTKYYSYFQDHFNILVFGFFEDDTAALIATFWKNYPVLWYFAGAFFCYWLLHRFLKYFFKPLKTIPTTEKMHWILLPVVGLVTIVVVFFLGRGSFGLFPLGPADTVISKDPFLNHLSSNGIHALFRAVKLRKQQNSEWDNNMKYYGYSDPKQAFADFYQLPVDQVPENPLTLFHKTTPKNEWAEKTQPHVIVLMMESFGTHWLSYHSPTFNLLGELEKHLNEDIFLKNFLPSASSTTGSLSSMMISAPHRPIGNFLTESQYLQVPFRSSPARIYSRAGYETHFIYGGNPGWRDMNKFARFQGFDFVEGDVDMQAKLGAFKEVHDWGVYDEDVFRYVKTLLKEAKKPQMMLVMTTTNHPPYQIPSNFQMPVQKIPPELESRLVGERQIIESRFRTYYYSSQKLGEFLSDLKSSEMGEKTVVAVTGDHGFLLINFSDEELLQKWSVPFYLYTPKSLNLSLNPETFGSHMDIFPTLYNLTLSEKEYDALGVDLLNPKAPHYAFHSSGLAVGPEGGALLLGKSGTSYFDWQGKFEKLKPGAETEERKAMAVRYKSLMSLLDFYFISEKKAERK